MSPHLLPTWACSPALMGHSAARSNHRLNKASRWKAWRQVSCRIAFVTSSPGHGPRSYPASQHARPSAAALVQIACRYSRGDPAPALKKTVQTPRLMSWGHARMSAARDVPSVDRPFRRRNFSRSHIVDVLGRPPVESGDANMRWSRRVREARLGDGVAAGSPWICQALLLRCVHMHPAHFVELANARRKADGGVGEGSRWSEVAAPPACWSL